MTTMGDSRYVLRDVCHTCDWISEPYDGGPLPIPDTTSYGQNQ